MSEIKLNELLKLPVRFDGIKYIFGDDSIMVAEVRGWGKLSTEFNNGKRSYNGELGVERMDAVGNFIADAINNYERNEQRIKELEARVLEYENAEASVCPEDVGFVEYIKHLEKLRIKVLADFLTMDELLTDGVMIDKEIAGNIWKALLREAKSVVEAEKSK